MTRTMLVVDDDERLRERLAGALAERGYATLTAGDRDAAISIAEAHAIDRAVVDLRMPGPHGLVVIQELLQLWPACEIVVLTGYGSIATAVEAIRLGAVHYLTKPADADQILAALQRGTEAETPAAVGEPLSLARAEWEHINHVLVSVSGNISEAARRLGLHRRSLQRKLAKYPPAR